MTPSKTLPVAPGDRIHFTASGFTFSTSDDFSSGHVSLRGQTITITATLIEASLDRNGDSWLSRLNDPADTRPFEKGPWPESESVHLRGTPGWERAREDARLSAHAIPDANDRAKALRAVVKDFGPAPTHQTSTEYRGSTTIPAREQA